MDENTLRTALVRAKELTWKRRENLRRLVNVLTLINLGAGALTAGAAAAVLGALLRPDSLPLVTGIAGIVTLLSSGILTRFSLAGSVTQLTEAAMEIERTLTLWGTQGLDFDGASKRLSELQQKYPDLANPEIYRSS